MHGRDAVLPSDLLLGRSLDLNEPDTSVEKSDYKINLLSTLKHAYESLSLKRRIESHKLSCWRPSDGFLADSA